MRKITLRSVRSHPVRIILSVLAVVLGVAFLSGTFSLRTMMSSTFSDIVDGSMRADIYVQGHNDDENGGTSQIQGSDSASKIPASYADDVAKVPGVAHAFADIEGSMILVGKDGLAVQQSGGPSSAIVVDPKDSAAEVSHGRLPRTSGEVAFEADTLTRSGYRIGETAKIILGGKITEQKIVGELSYNFALSGATFVVVDKKTGMELFAPDGNVTSISVYLDSGQKANAVAKNIAKTLPSHGVQVKTGDELREKAKEAISSMLGFVTTFLMIFALIALFVGGFIIANTFAMLVRQRQRELAVLRALGASRWQVFTQVVSQAAIIGFVGSALGILGGYGLIQIVRAVFSSMGMEMSGSIPLSVSGVGGAIVIGTVVAMVSAAFPALRAARTPPVEAMNENTSTAEKSLRIRGIVGGVLFVVGVGSLVGAIARGSEGETLLWPAGGGILFGLLVLAPVIVPAAMKVLSLPFRGIRPIGKLAARNLTLNARRTASTASALMIGMALVGAATVVASSTQGSLEAIVGEDLNTDFIVQGAQNPVPEGFVEAAPALSKVEGTWVFRAAQLSVNGKNENVGRIPRGLYPEAVNPRLVKGSLERFDAGEALVREGYAKEMGWKLGDTLTFINPSAPQMPPHKVKIGAITESQMTFGNVVLSQARLDQLVPTATQTPAWILFVKAKSGQISAAQKELTELAKPYLVLSVDNKEEFANSMASQVNQMLYVIYALLALSIVIAALGIVNTLTLSIMEQTRQIGLTRAVGLGRAQQGGQVVIESVLISLFGAVLGLAAGVGLAAALPEVFADSGLKTLVIPWTSLAVMVGLAGVIGVLAALWPAVRAARLPVLEAISYE